MLLVEHISSQQPTVILKLLQMKIEISGVFTVSRKVGVASA
jgi:hypothetical protein